MKKNILTFGIVTVISVLLFSPRSRNAICNSVNGETVNKLYEMKNVLDDFKKNNSDTSF